MTRFHVFVSLCLLLMTLLANTPSSYAFIIPPSKSSLSDVVSKWNGFNKVMFTSAATIVCPNQRRLLQASSGDDQGDMSDESSTPAEDEDANCTGSSSSSNSNNNKNKKSIIEQAKERIESIYVEKVRQELEVANTKSFIKRRPIKLPYNDARIWVQANLGCDTKEEFDDFVANGILRTPYIPKNPESYYTNTREWISWDHFLTGCFDNNTPSAVQPKTGVFD